MFKIWFRGTPFCHMSSNMLSCAISKHKFLGHPHITITITAQICIVPLTVLDGSTPQAEKAKAKI